MTVAIRRMEEKDHPVKGQLHKACWEETYRGLLPGGLLDQLTAESCTAMAGQFPGETYLLEADGLAVGFACICRESRPFVERPGSCEVAALYLRREWQGRGLGRRLLAFCLDQLPPGKAVVLFVAKGNGKAAGFYRRMGFSPTGRVLRDETPWGPVEEEEWMGCCR